MTGELHVWGCARPVGADLLDRPADHPVLVRFSKGLGTREDRPDVRGLAIRVPSHGTDLLLSTVGSGRWGRHVPMPRRSFDAVYGSITPYRSGSGNLYLAAAPMGTPLGGSVAAVASAADQDRSGLLLYVLRSGEAQPFAQLTLGEVLPEEADAALAFDPIRNTTGDLHPTGLIHGTRAFAYRASQRWRGAPSA